MPLELPFLSERVLRAEPRGGQYKLLPLSERSGAAARELDLRPLDLSGRGPPRHAQDPGIAKGELPPSDWSEPKRLESSPTATASTSCTPGADGGRQELAPELSGRQPQSIQPEEQPETCHASVEPCAQPESVSRSERAEECGAAGGAGGAAAGVEAGPPELAGEVLQGAPQLPGVANRIPSKQQGDEGKAGPLLQETAEVTGVDLHEDAPDRPPSVKRLVWTHPLRQVTPYGSEDAEQKEAKRAKSKEARQTDTPRAKQVIRTRLPLVKIVWGLTILSIINMLVLMVAKPTFRSPHTQKLQTWEPYVVLNALIVSIVLLASGLPADLLLLGFASLFCTLRIITCEELLGGLSNEGVVAVAALCAVSASIDKTKALNGILGPCLGLPRSPSVGMMRMAFALISFGSVFNNTPLVAVFIPIVKEWTSKAGLDVGHFMMPLSFFAMLSATLTTMGSSTNLLAVKLVPEAGINFFDPAPVGVAVIITGVVYCAVLGPYMLPAVGVETPDSTGAGEDDDLETAPKVKPPVRDRYTVQFKLASEGPLLCSSARAVGLLDALEPPATVRCTVGDGSKDLEAGERIEVSNATAEDIMSLAAIPGLGLQALSAWFTAGPVDKPQRSLWKKAKFVKMAMAFKQNALRADREPDFTTDRTNSAFDEHFESGIESVNRMTMPVRRWVAAGMDGGWANPGHALLKLVVPAGGPAGVRYLPRSGGDSVSATALGMTELQRLLKDLRCTLVGMSGICPDQDGKLIFDGGEVLLVEAPTAKISKELECNFALVSAIGEKFPPARVRLSSLDPYRPALAVAGLLATVVAAALDIAPLDAVAIIVALSSILLGTLSGQDLYRSINGPVLLTVAASFGIGAAIYNTGLATCLASGVLFIAEPAGHTAIMGALVGVALALGIFVSNNTVVILLTPLIKDICKRQDLNLKMAMLGVIYAANLSFATPFSYQTNMMVMPHGRYVFIDYVKFGVPMMLICGTVALFGTCAYWG